MLLLVADLDPLGARADEVFQRGVQVQRIAHLVKVRHGHIRAQTHCAPGAVAGFGFGRVGGGRVGLVLTQYELEQRGLARAVGPEQADFVAAQNGGSEVPHDEAFLFCACAKCLAHMHHLGDQLAALVAAAHVHVDAADHVAARFALAAQLIEPHDARGGTGAPGFHALADPHLFLRQQFVGLGVDHGLLGQLLFFLHQVGGKVAGVGEQLATVQLDDAGGHVVQKRAVVGDGDDRALEVHQQALQPLNAVQVQVVGGLVQQQHVGLGHQGLGQCHTLFGTAGEGAHNRLGVQVQAVQGLGDALLPVPAVQGFDFALHGVQIAMAQAILFN